MKFIPIFIFLNFIPFIYSGCLRGIPSKHPLNLVVQRNRAIEGQFPYLVSIQTLKDGHVCGGSIINRRWILTAGHCISNGKIQTDLSQLRILAGTINLDQGGVRYNVEKIIIHGDFDFAINRNDIALLKIDQDIEFNNLISSIPLASSETPANATVISGGWGASTVPKKATNDLQFLELFAVPTVMCIYNFPDLEIFNNNICAQPKKLGTGTCIGDSGGPLVYNGEIVGVLSWGAVCGGPDPEVYSKVTSFQDWINENIGQ